MRQLRANDNRLNRQLQSSEEHFGVIYLSWNRKRNCSDHTEREIRALWRSFAEREARNIIFSSVVLIQLRWMNEDLFIHMMMPKGQQEVLEGWLLELAYKQLANLESRFHEETRRIGRGEELFCQSKLHVGVAVVVNNAEHRVDCGWYEASKQAILHGQSTNALKYSLRRRAFGDLIVKGGIYPVYQPIVSIHDRSVFGYESLTRLEDRSWFDGPEQLFEFAESEGQMYLIDRLAREKAIDGCCNLLQKQQKLFINVMAQIMEDPEFSPGQTKDLLQQHHLSPHNVVFEITERNAIVDFGSVKKALEHYRNQGYQIAIDDVGAGYSSLQSIVELRPDYLKVDRSIIKDIHLDEMKTHILHTLLEIGAKMDIALIAEGIEQQAELDKIASMGVHYAQGYLIGRPAPLLQ